MNEWVLEKHESKRLGLKLKRRNGHSSYIGITDRKSAYTSTEVYGLNEHRVETKPMLLEHTFIILDILAEKPKKAHEFSVSSLTSYGRKLIPKKMTRENTGSILDEKISEVKSDFDKRFWLLSLHLFASVFISFFPLFL